MRSSEEEKPVDKQESGSKNEPEQEMNSNLTIIPKTENTQENPVWRKIIKNQLIELFQKQKMKITEKIHSLIDQFLETKNETLFQKIMPKKKFESLRGKIKQIWDKQSDEKLRKLIEQMCFCQINPEEEIEIIQQIKNNELDYIKENYLSQDDFEIFEEKLSQILNRPKIKESEGQKIKVKVQQESDKIFFQFQKNTYNFLSLVEKMEKKLREKIKYFSIYYNHEESPIQVTKNNFQTEWKSFFCFERYPYTVLLKETRLKLNLHKKMPFKSQKPFLHTQLKDHSKKQHQYYFLFTNERTPILLQDEERSLQTVEQEKGRIEKLEIIFLLQIHVQGLSFDEKFSLNSKETILDLKKQISRKHNFTFNAIELSEILENEKEEKKQLENEKCISSLKNQDLYLILKLKVSLEHYGFNKNCSIVSNDYLSFFRETEQAQKQLIKNCNPDKPEKQKKFQSLFLKFCYSAIKKGFSIQTLIEKYRTQLSRQSGANIWKVQKQTQSLTFNSLFVLMFILYNSDEKARTIIMNQAKTYLPLPTHFRSFNSIQQILPHFKFNKSLPYILSHGFTIVSIGFHHENRGAEAGKTDFLSKTFYTDMILKENLHGILKGCPLLYLNVFDDIFPLHLIDVPYDFPNEHLQQLLKCANLVIIHSWLDQDETSERMKDYDYKCDVKVYYRDIEEMKFLQTAKQIERSNAIKIPNMSKYHKSENIYLNIRNQLFKHLQELSSNQNPAKIQKLIEDDKVQELLKIMSKVQKNIFQLNVVGKEIEKFSSLEKDQIINLKKKILGEGIHPVLKELLVFLYQCPSNQRTLLSILLRNRLRQIKMKSDKPFNVLFQLEKKIHNINFGSYDEERKFEEMCTSEAKLPIIKDWIEGGELSTKLAKNNSSQFLKNINKIIPFYENEIKPNIFSYQLLWRELVGLLKCQKKVEIDGIEVKNIFTELKREELSEQQPFEIIDGDLLEMNQNVVADCFKTFKKKVCVVSVLGPQSSGKSTLLNFLFGCSFTTSSGRCTRGVYGTYFEFHNTELFSCDGIFLIDTEGIMANTTEKDKEKRNNFDTKLVLFCLSISDIVIINTKGNLDKNTSQIVSLCSERLDILVNEKNEPKPYLFLTLNQNNSANIQESAQDIARLREQLDIQANGARQLSQAYEIRQIKSKQIKLIPENTQLIRKRPKKQFNDECISLQNLVFAHIKKKSDEGVKFDKMKNVVAKMQKMWTVISKFPNLYNSYQKQTRDVIKELEDYQNKMKVNEVEIQIDNLLKKFRKGTSRMEINIEFRNFVDKIKSSAEFASNFTTKEKELAETTQKRITYKNKFQNYLGQCEQNLKSKCQLIVREKNLKKEIEFGNDRLRERALGIREKNFSEDKKLEIFQKEFTILSSEIEKQLKFKEQFLNLFQNFQYSYKNELRSEIGLVQFNQKIEKNISSSVEQFKKQLFSTYFQKYKQDKKFVQFSNEPPINNIVKNGGKGINDAKGEYFDILQYFEDDVSFHGLYVHHKKIHDFLNYKRIEEEVKKALLNNYKIKAVVQGQYKKVENNLRNYGYQILSKQIFAEYFNSFYLTGTGCQKNFNIIKLDQKKKSFKDSFLQWIPFLDYSKYVECILKRQQLLKYLKQHKKYLSFHLFSEKFAEYLDWKKLSKIVQKQVNNFSVLNSICYSLEKTLNKQLLQLGIKVENIDEYVKKIILKHEKKPLFKFKFSQQQREVKNFEEFQKKNRFFYFVQTEKLGNIIDLTRYEGQKKDYHCICSCSEEEMTPRKDYSNKHEFLKKFLLKSHEEFVESLKNQEITQFIEGQLRDKQKVQDLLNKIDFFINDNFQIQNDDATERMARNIEQKIRKEIENFNLDLNLVGHCLDKLFIGEVNLYGILMWWKITSIEMYKKKKKIYDDFLKQKQSQKKIFLGYASNNTEANSQAEAQRFFKHFKSYFEIKVKQRKEILINKESKEFKKNYPLSFVTNQLDKDIEKQSDLKKIEEYIQNPNKVRKSYFQVLYDGSCKELRKNAEEIIKLGENEELKFLQNMKSLLSNLYEEIKKSKAEKECEWSKLFKFTVLNDGAKKDVPVCLMKYFIDLMTWKEKDQYSTENVTCSIPPENRIKFISNLSNNAEIVNFFDELKKKKNEVSNLSVFTKKLIEIFKQKTEQLKEMFIVNNDEIKKHRQEIKVKLCDEKCPCCGRICGVIHDSKENIYHECKFGHQIRAFGGMKFNNGNPSTKRCEELTQKDEILYNGQLIPWSTFKMKIKGGKRKWIYDDCKENNIYRAQIFEKVWKTYGPTFCQNYTNSKGVKEKMNYITLEEAKKENASYSSSNGKPNHYIIILDESYSMSAHCGNKKRWAVLIQSVKHLFGQMKIKSADSLRISLLLMSSSCKVREKNVAISQINSLPEFSGGGTNFESAFIQVNKIAMEYYQQQNIGVIFMTDGQGGYPEKQILKLRELQQKAKKENSKIVYFGIQFVEESETMEKIRQKLNGKTEKPKNSLELMETYGRAIEIFNE